MPGRSPHLAMAGSKLPSARMAARLAVYADSTMTPNRPQLRLTIHTAHERPRGIRAWPMSAIQDSSKKLSVAASANLMLCKLPSGTGLLHRHNWLLISPLPWVSTHNAGDQTYHRRYRAQPSHAIKESAGNGVMTRDHRYHRGCKAKPSHVIKDCSRQMHAAQHSCYTGQGRPRSAVCDSVTK